MKILFQWKHFQQSDYFFKLYKQILDQYVSVNLLPYLGVYKCQIEILTDLSVTAEQLKLEHSCLLSWG